MQTEKQKQKNRERYQANREAIRNYQKEYYRTHREAILKRKREVGFLTYGTANERRKNIST